MTEDISKAAHATTDEAISETVGTKMESDALMEILHTIKDEYREVLVMRYLSEMEVGEIASALEKTSNAIRILLHRAKKALEEKMKKVL